VEHRTDVGNATPIYGPTTLVAAKRHLLPDGTMWTFSYDEYGDVTRLGFSYGRSISYTYAVGPAKWNFGQDRQKHVGALRSVDANDGSGGHAWTYNYSVTFQSQSEHYEQLLCGRSRGGHKSNR